MEPKKEASVKSLAARHVITSILMAILIQLIPVFIIAGVVITTSDRGFIQAFSPLYTLVWLFALWFGVRYSAKSLKEKYLIINSDEIAKIATLCWAIIVAIVFILSTLKTGLTFTFNDLFNGLKMLIGLAVFYALSHYYLAEIPKSNPLNTSTQ